MQVDFHLFGNLVAADEPFAPAAGGGDRDRYLWLAGFAFALLAVSGLSLQLMSFGVRTPTR